MGKQAQCDTLKLNFGSSVVKKKKKKFAMDVLNFVLPQLTTFNTETRSLFCVTRVFLYCGSDSKTQRTEQ